MLSAEEKVGAIVSFDWTDEERDAVVLAATCPDPWQHEADELADVMDVLVKLKRRLAVLHLELQGMTCCYCKAILAGGGHFMIDREHILPKKKYADLTYEPLNLSVSCKRCNMEFKGQRVDFVVDPESILDDFRNEARYRFVHPNFDTWGDHLHRITLQDNEYVLVKYVIKAKSDKGAYTHDFFKLGDLEVDSFDRAQGMDVLDERGDIFRQALEAPELGLEAIAVADIRGDAPQVIENQSVLTLEVNANTLLLMLAEKGS